MSLMEAIKNQNINMRQLSERSHVSYAAIYDIAHGKTPLSDCKYATVKKLADALSVPTEFLVQTDDFRHFRDQLHTELKQEGTDNFLIRQLSEDNVSKHYKSGYTARAMYLMCLSDYLCMIEHVPVPDSYDFLRNTKLTPPLKIAMYNNHPSPKYIPIFEKHGILEGEIFDAV